MHLFNTLVRLTSIMLFVVGAARAHDLEITAAVIGGEIQGKVFYPSGEATAGAGVKLLDHHAHVLSEGKTDPQGRFTFPAPREFPVTVAAETEDGHRDEISLQSPEHPAAPTAAHEHSHANPDAISADRVRTIVQEELRPLREQLAEQSSRTRARDIFGGIGYIVGVFGLIVLLKRNPGKRG